MKGKLVRRKPRPMRFTRLEAEQVKAVSGRVRPFRAIRYQIATTEGKIFVEGLQLKDNGDLAIRPVPNAGDIKALDPLWKIDHVPTGYQISRGNGLDLKRCVALAIALGRLDWAGADMQVLSKNGPQVFAAMDELKIDYGYGIKLKEGDVVEIDLGKMKVGDSVKFRL